MLPRLLADAVLVTHLAFILFVILGGALVAWRRWFVFIHIPAAIWGVLIEVSGWICPLTYLENHLRRQAGQDGYTESFIEHYLLPVIYPEGLTRETQFTLAIVVIAINVSVYVTLFLRRRASDGHDWHKKPSEVRNGTPTD
jgi:hypothetical protein